MLNALVFINLHVIPYCHYCWHSNIVEMNNDFKTLAEETKLCLTQLIILEVK